MRRTSVFAEGENLGAGGIHFRRAFEIPKGGAALQAAEPKKKDTPKACLSFWWRRGELNPRSPSPLSFPTIPSGLAPQQIAAFGVFSFSCLIRPIPFSLVTFYLPEYLPTNRTAYVELPMANFLYMSPVLFFECRKPAPQKLRQAIYRQRWPYHTEHTVPQAAFPLDRLSSAL